MLRKSIIEKHFYLKAIPWFVKLLFEQAIKEVTPENWRNFVKHVIKEEQKMWDFDNVIDRTVNPLIIISRGDDSSSDDEEYYIS